MVVWKEHAESEQTILVWIVMLSVPALTVSCRFTSNDIEYGVGVVVSTVDVDTVDVDTVDVEDNVRIGCHQVGLSSEL
ncbi:hypothetical protein GCK72_003918 [Caenorhabditis remanei]|uniref:Uncharacterized protein n=1 Tax=Caenorhabditis remanei TaxID=31234 RepID=A0A6A5HC39_CAERE|nr:hypothetical protein GCK72_003918 [Caenorhabditis remanei]KAF1763972.1 hypothetical protein GCK72_003918 [Caenorhabditis remanei]